MSETVDGPPCPLCGTRHERGDFKNYDVVRDGEEVTISTSPDVYCRCGLILRAEVPLVKMNKWAFRWTPHGYHDEGEDELIERLRNAQTRD